MGLCETYYGVFRGKVGNGGSGWMGWGMSVGKWRDGGVKKKLERPGSVCISPVNVIVCT